MDLKYCKVYTDDLPCSIEDLLSMASNVPVEFSMEALAEIAAFGQVPDEVLAQISFVNKSDKPEFYPWMTSASANRAYAEELDKTKIFDQDFPEIKK